MRDEMCMLTTATKGDCSHYLGTRRLDEWCTVCLNERKIDELTAEVSRLTQQLAEREAEIEATIEMLPVKVICREGGGPENKIGTLTLSIMRVISERATLTSEVSRLTRELSQERIEWMLVNDANDQLRQERDKGV